VAIAITTNKRSANFRLFPMCTNYRPSSLEAFRKGIPEDIRETKIRPFKAKAEVFPNELAPIIRLEHEEAAESRNLEWVPARFGLVPMWAKEEQVAKLGRMAYNARTETVSSKPMFRYAWRHRQFCLVPTDAFYEPNWESGQAVRWRIEMANREPFAIGGIWERHGEGDQYFESFSMLTINADAHPLMNHFHRAGDEKRMPVIIEASNYRDWLLATAESAPQFFKPYPAELMTSKPEPLPPRPKKEKPSAKAKEEIIAQPDELF
jgi:putative SOS response-associated peptidase YedK